MNWNLFLFFSIYLCSTSQRNAYNLFFALSRLKLPLSFLPFRFAAPCSLHRCSSAFHFRFTRSFEFLNAAFPRATALLLYTLFLILSTLFLVEDFYWILSINCVIYTKQVVFNRFFRKMRGFLCWNGVRIVFFGENSLCKVRQGWGTSPACLGNRNCPWNLDSYYNLLILKAIAILPIFS